MHFSAFTESRDFTETNYKSLSGQINVNEAKGIVECFVAAIGNKDSVGDICLPGCFTESLKRRKPRVVWGHNWNEPIGKVLEIYEVGPSDPRLPSKMRERGVGGLFAKVQFNLGAEKGREAFANVAFFGLEQEWSIGYKTLDAVFDSGQQANLLKEVELYEVSPVLHGANQLTATLSIKTANQLDEYEEKASDKPLRDPKGGLTAAGRAHFKRTEGANLKPGVKGPADTPEKMRRKGSFLTRFFTNPSGPMKDEKGKPTRLALSAAAWGEPVPQDRSDAAALAAKGRRLLERYENSKGKSANADLEEKNHSLIYAQNTGATSNPSSGRMGALARSISMHFGGEVVVRSADENMVIFDLRKDGTTETMRAGYHTPNEVDFMFGPATRVRQEVVYIPVEGSTGSRVDGFDLPSKPSGGCGCGGACGGAKSECQCGGSCGGTCQTNFLKSWSDFKSDNPGMHLFIKTADMDMYQAAQEIGFHHGFDVELLSDGFAVPNIDWYGEDASQALITAVEGIAQKFAFGRAGRNARGAASRAVRNVKPATFDGDNDGFMTGPTGMDNVPYSPRMPKEDEEDDIPEKIPERQPTRVPQPVRPGTPAPARPTPVRPDPVRPGIPTGDISPRMPKEDEEDDIPEKIPERQPTRVPQPVRPGTPAPARPTPVRPDPVRPGIPTGESRRDAIRRQMLEALRRQYMASRGKSDSVSMFMTVSESYDINVKTAQNINTIDIDTIVLEMPIGEIFEFKSLVDPVLEYHQINVAAVDAGLKIYDASKLSEDALRAMVSVIKNW